MTAAADWHCRFLAEVEERCDDRRERVALLLGEREGPHVQILGRVWVRNDSVFDREFVVNRSDQVKTYEVAEFLGVQVVGLFHSHPSLDARPSSEDLASMLLEDTAGWVWPIWSVRHQVMRVWTIEPGADPVEVELSLV